MSKRSQVNDRSAARRRTPNRIGIEHVLTVGDVETGDLVTEICQVPGHHDADIAPVAGDENAHADNDRRRRAMSRATFTSLA